MGEAGSRGRGWEAALPRLRSGRLGLGPIRIGPGLCDHPDLGRYGPGRARPEGPPRRSAEPTAGCRERKGPCHLTILRIGRRWCAGFALVGRDARITSGSVAGHCTAALLSVPDFASGSDAALACRARHADKAVLPEAVPDEARGSPARREGRLRGRLRAEPDSGGGSKATEFRVLEAIRGVEVGRIVRIGADPRVCSSALHGPDVCRRGFVAGEIGGEGDKVLVGFRNSGMPGPPRVPDRPRRLAAPGAFATVHPSAAWSRPRKNPGARVVRGPRGSPRRRRPTSSRRRGRRCRPRRAAPRARRASCCRRTARD